MTSLYKKEENLGFRFIFLLVALVFIYVRPYEIKVFSFLIALRPTKILLILSFLLYFLNKGLPKHILKEPVFLWFIAIQLIAVIFLPFSDWKSRSLGSIMNVNLRIVMVFYIVMLAADSRRRIEALMRTIFLCCSAVAVRVILAFKSGSYFFAMDGTKRVAGVGTLGSDDPNDLALVMAMAVSIGLYYWHTGKGFKKWASAALIVLMISALLLTGSRGGYLGVGFGLIVFYAFLFRKKKAKFVLVVALLAVLAVLFVPQTYKARFTSMFAEDEYSRVDECHGRVYIWKRAWKAMWKRPVGYGMGNASLAEGKEKAAEKMQGKWMVTHNAYLQIGLELGVLGLFCYLMFLWGGFVNIVKTLGLCRGSDRRREEVMACALAGGLGAFLMSSFFLSQAYYWNHYIFIAMTAGLRRVLETENVGRIEDEGKEKKNVRKWKSRALSGKLRKTHDI